MTALKFLGAIKGLKMGKCSGQDRFTPPLYKTFAPLLTPLLALASNAIDSSTLPSEGSCQQMCLFFWILAMIFPNAVVAIVQFLAEHGSQTLCECPCQPLISSCLELFTGIRLVLSQAVRQGTTQPKTIHHISYIQRLTWKPVSCLSMPEKAFNRVNWRFLRLLWEQIGLGASFMSKVMSFYSQPSASVLVNGTSSEPFDISNGTRQGCPLLFVIVIEHLASAIPQNVLIQGIQTPSSLHKLSLYADDISDYVQQPRTSLPLLFSEFRRFVSFGNFKPNICKTGALNVSLPASTISLLCSQLFL